jgi:hypothetical protein
MAKSRALKETMAMPPIKTKAKSMKQITKEMHTSGKEDMAYGKETMMRGKVKMMGAQKMMNEKIMED